MRLAVTVGLLSITAAAWGHHWVGDIYDDRLRFIAEVEVVEFELINPHPLMHVEIIALPEISGSETVEPGETWTLEMDNRRELTALGFDAETFAAGDRLQVAVDPIRVTSYRENTLYLRALEHTSAGFIYVHNVRRLYPTGTAGESLASYLDQIR